MKGVLDIFTHLILPSEYVLVFLWCVLIVPKRFPFSCQDITSPGTSLFGFFLLRLQNFLTIDITDSPDGSCCSLSCPHSALEIPFMISALCPALFYLICFAVCFCWVFVSFRLVGDIFLLGNILNWRSYSITETLVLGLTWRTDYNW